MFFTATESIHDLILTVSSAVGSKFVLGGLNYGLESGSNERARVAYEVSEH